MDENKLKAIVEEVVNKAVNPIKQDLSGVKLTLENHTRRLEALSGDMNKFFQK